MISHLVLHPAPRKEPTEILLEHRQLGYWDLRWHYLVKPCGTIHVGRPEEKPGVATPFHDASSLAIGVALTVKTRSKGVRRWPGPQLESLADLLRQLMFNHPESTPCLISQLAPNIDFPGGRELFDALKPRL